MTTKLLTMLSIETEESQILMENPDQIVDIFSNVGHTRRNLEIFLRVFVSQLIMWHKMADKMKH